MGKCLEILSGGATAPDTTLTDLTMASGDSLTIREHNAGECSLLTLWTTGQTTAGSCVLRSSRMHDNVRGITVPSPAAAAIPQVWNPFLQKFQPQDSLICQISGSATSGDIEQAALLVFYDDLPGIDAKLLTPEELAARFKNLLTVQNSITAATGPNYTGAQVIHTTNDNFKANTSYALLGFNNTVKCHAITWRGSDTGNIRLGGPGNLGGDALTRNWFVELSFLSGKPCIPVINSANKANTYIECSQDENAAATVVTSFWAELSGGA